MQCEKERNGTGNHLSKSGPNQKTDSSDGKLFEATRCYKLSFPLLSVYFFVFKSVLLCLLMLFVTVVVNYPKRTNPKKKTNTQNTQKILKRKKTFVIG